MKWLKNLFQRSITVKELKNITLGGQASDAGPVVNEANALALSALWAGFRTITSDIASLEPHLFYEIEGQVIKAIDHPIYDLIQNPNPEMTRPVFYETFAYFCLLGNGLAEIERNRAGEAIALWPLHPHYVSMERDTSGKLIYVVHSTKEDIELTEDDVLHVPGLCIDGSGWGAKLLKQQRDSIGFALAAQRWGSAFFRNAVRPSGALKIPASFSEIAKENVKKSIQEANSKENVGRLMPLEEGIEFQPFSFATNEQVQYKELLEFVNLQVSQMLNINPIKIGDMSRATWANFTECQQSHLQDCINPWLVKICAEMHKKLVPFEDKRNHYIEFDSSTITRANESIRFANYQIALQNKIMTVNEVRAKENLPPIQDDGTGVE